MLSKAESEETLTVRYTFYLYTPTPHNPHNKNTEINKDIIYSRYLVKYFFVLG